MSNLKPAIVDKDFEDQSSISHLSLEEALRSIKQIQQEKAVLESKIRGYMTLSDIFYVQKEDHKKLKIKYDKLVELNKEKNLQQESYLSMEQKSVTTKTREDQERNRTQTTMDNDLNMAGTQQGTDIGIPPGTNTSGKSSASTEGATSREDDTHPTNRDVILDHSGSSRVQSLVRETIPMQESLVAEYYSELNPPTDQQRNGKSETFASSSRSSDLALGQSAGLSSLKDNLIQISSSLLGQSSHVSINLKQKSITLSDLKRNLETAHASDHVVSLVKEEFVKLEQKVHLLEDTNAILIENSQQLKSANKVLVQQLKDWRTRCEELEKQQVTSETSLQDAGWVKVEKRSESKQKTDTPDTNTEPQVEKLQKEIKQLKDANQRWVQQWETLQHHVQSQMDTLQQERDQLSRELTNLKIQDEKRQRDFDKSFESLKKKCQDEEAAKEDALLQLGQAGRRTDSIQEKLRFVEDRLHNIEREKQTLGVELSVVKQRPATVTAQQAHEAVATGGASSRALSDLKTENEVLRQQLLVFQEDFDRERQDRATAQSNKEQYKKKNETLKTRTRVLEQKTTTLEKQVSNAEDAHRNALDAKQSLQQELCEVKNQLRREQEANKVQMYQMPPQYSQPPAMMGPYMYPQPPAFYPQPPPQMMPQYVAPIGQNLQANNRPYQQYQDNTVQTRVEAMPGAWDCQSCTYRNYPGRTVCEMCGYVQPHGRNGRPAVYGSSPGILRPRGDEPDAGPYQHHNPNMRRGGGP